jgi:hypothetical protein
MNTAPEKRFSLALFFILLLARSAFSQANPEVISSAAGQTAGSGDSEQVSQILGLGPAVERLRALQAQRSCGSVASVEELMIRLGLLESLQTALLDVDGVIAENLNERGQLSNLRTSLQARRDHAVTKLNAAALITGSGVGAAVSATQFTSLGPRVNNAGDGVGIGAGIASTVLAFMAVRQQHGPKGSVGEVSNMLAPLFDQSPVLNTYYPPPVLRYLQSVPANVDGPERATRLEKLRTEWVAAGRLDASDSVKQQQKIQVLTVGNNNDIRISIDDLTDRTAMLADVSGRVSLMKRDIGTLMRSYMGDSGGCKPQ